jgi:uncharacterized protein YceK
MKQLYIAFLAILIASLLSGCATAHDPQQTEPKNAAQNNAGPTISGYIDIGAQKSFH